MIDEPAPTKAMARADALARRASVSHEVRQAFAHRLASLGPDIVRTQEWSLAGPTVSVFLPIRDEPDTRPLIGALTTRGLVTALPVTVARGRPLQFRAWRMGEPLERGQWDIETPSAEAALVDPDVLFVPLAAFNRRGSRIGYGGGYYDATLAALRRAKSIRAIGVAFACQETSDLPTEPHDEKLDLVITERDVVRCEP